MPTETKFQFRIAPQIAGDDIERRGRVTRELEMRKLSHRKLKQLARTASPRALMDATDALEREARFFSMDTDFREVARLAEKVAREARKMVARKELERFERRQIRDGYAFRKRVKS